jgi:hypothetical protein
VIEIIYGLIIAAGGFYIGVMVTISRYSAKMQDFRKELAAIQLTLKKGKS